MKTLCTTTMIAVLLLSLFGCNNQQSQQLTEHQKEQIKNEVKTALDSIIAKTNKPDMDGFLQCYSSDLVCVIDLLWETTKVIKRDGLVFQVS
jgi:uncharacterized lipoprotein NlpE involved in copper resistance